MTGGERSNFRPAVFSFLGFAAHLVQRRCRSTKRQATFEVSCDYMIVGAGATGVAFADTLLRHHPSDDISVMMVDSHSKPGGHWNDAYDFVNLHQSASNYGVDSRKLEDLVSHPELQASRSEILDYYACVVDDYISKSKITFVPNAKFDFKSSSFEDLASKDSWTVSAGTVVDARFTEPDIPSVVPPRFQYNSCVNVITPNELSQHSALRDHFCVIGGGKTGQDCIIYLQEELGIAPQCISWVLPRDSWITARNPPMDTCMEFINTCLQAHSQESSAPLSVEFVQRGFLELEKQGKVYRIDKSVEPTKFGNATLNKHEVDLLRKVSANIIREGRVSKILDSGQLQFASGSVVTLPWEDASKTTSFVHCSAGAFNLSKSRGDKAAVFQPGRITLQEIFSYPGFCFNGSLIARLECEDLSLEEKNAMCELPVNAASKNPLGPSGGDIVALHEGHGLVIALRNLRRWYARPSLAKWLHQSRLFSLTMNGYSLAEGQGLIDRNWAGLQKLGIVKD